MASVTTSAIAQLHGQVERLASDPELDPTDRVGQLRALRDDLAFVLGACDRYLSDQELQREGQAIGGVHDRLAARENADVRGVLIDRRMATPEQLDAAGMLSHDELDRRAQDGTLDEAVVGIAHLFDPQKHPRGRGGKFSTSGGRQVPKGRRGQTLTAPRELAPPDRRPGPVERSPGVPEEPPLFLGGVRTDAVRGQLGSARDTKEKYSVPLQATPGTTQGEEPPRQYTPERMAQHRKWIEEALAGGKSQPEGKRQIVFVSGGPGSGKSSAEEYMPKVPDAIELDQDNFKAKIDEYAKLAEQRDPYASDAAHREAADLAHAARVEAMRRGYNVIVQGTGDSGPGQFSQKVAEAADSGYKTHVFGVSAPTEVGLARAQGRAKDNGRAVPEEGLRAMHANVSRNWPEIEALAPKLESLQLFDSREDTRKGGKARLMQHLDKPHGQLVEDYPERMAEYRAKAQEDPGTLIQNRSYV